MPRGRQPGQYVAGTLGGWLSRAKAGESFWTEQDQRAADTTARRMGRRAETRVFLAIHPDSVTVVRLTRVTVLADDPPPA